MKKVLVTGGAGYIGAHTAVELIEAGYEVVIVDDFSKSDRTLLEGIEAVTSRKVNFFQGDCGDEAFLKGVFEWAGPFAAVMHFAAYKSVGESVEKPLDYYRNNLGSLISLLKTMKVFGVTNLIFSSSCTVYGQPDTIPVDEATPFKRAESPYGATKQMCERILEDAYSRGYRVISLRYFNPIGAHPSALLGELPVGTPNNLVPFITQTAAGIREKLTVFGDDYDTPDGTCVRDFIHVVDLAQGHLKALEYLSAVPAGDLCEVFNLGTGEGVSVLQLINKFVETTHVKVPYSIGPRRSGDVEKTYGNVSKANRILQWKARFSVEESLFHAWNWEKKIRDIKN
ncbi:MAG TPA: UDP-glucose 4-epimerase GalE [Chryseolinea sp.]|nr:UDP-glucose 4-epimerase GalE [Chryseolinea sp.]